MESSKTTTFLLRLAKENRDLAHATVSVLGDPGFITVSTGLPVTAEDVAKFNEQWMQPYERQQALVFATSGLQRHDPDVVWGAGERMAAMVRMFDLTRDRRYLDHLHEFTQAALAFRDDLAPDRPLDQIRNKAGLPAWGGTEVNSGGLHHVDEIVSSLYAYPIAAFARIVAEDPSLQVVYGNDAIDYANRVIETVNFFLPQIHRQRTGDFIEATLTLPLEYRDRPTEADCTRAHDKAKSEDPGNVARWDQKQRDCRRLRELAGRALPHNINLTFSMVLIELSRVLDSPFYLHAPKRAGGAENLRDFLLQLISRQQRYFANRLNAGNLAGFSACRQHFCWNYDDDLPADIDPRPEDTDHGAMDLSYVGLAFRDFGRLNAAASRFHEPLTLTTERFRGLARTFVDNVAAGSNFNRDVAGREPEAGDTSNTRCEGWLELTRADAKVYQACHDVSLRIVDGRQPYLNIGNHSSLLTNKASQPPP